MTELALPLVNAVGGMSMKLVYFGKGGVGPALLALALIVGLGAGLYPAVLFVRIQARAGAGGVQAAGWRQIGRRACARRVSGYSVRRRHRHRHLHLRDERPSKLHADGGSGISGVKA